MPKCMLLITAQKMTSLLMFKGEHSRGRDFLLWWCYFSGWKEFKYVFAPEDNLRTVARSQDAERVWNSKTLKRPNHPGFENSDMS